MILGVCKDILWLNRIEVIS